MIISILIIISAILENNIDFKWKVKSDDGPRTVII